MKNKTVIYAIINWGLGHATRSAPIIRRLIEDGNRVVLVSHGNALTLLREEFPGCIFRDVKDSRIDYPNVGFRFVFKIVFQLPKMIFGWGYERRRIKALEKEFHPDLVITEMRLGCWLKKVPSVLITHQLRFYLPDRLAWAGILGEWFNRIIFRNFSCVFVPDAAGTPNLSGDLSHKGRIAEHPKVRYIGCLSSIVPATETPAEDIDMLVSISGPEPQRTRFQEKVMEQLDHIPGKGIVALGLPGSEKNIVKQTERVTVYSHLNRREMSSVMQRAKHIVCRSGYSTVMELLALGKAAFFVPTPGQTEQEYLAEYYQKEGLFNYCEQEALDLKKIPLLTAAPAEKRNIPVNDLDTIITLLDTLCP